MKAETREERRAREVAAYRNRTRALTMNVSFGFTFTEADLEAIGAEHGIGARALARHHVRRWMQSAIREALRKQVEASTA